MGIRGFVVKAPRSRVVNKLFLRSSISSFVLCLLSTARLFLPTVLRAQDPQQYIEVDGTLRTFVVHLPLGYDSRNKYPLVILLHGAGDTASEMARLSRFDFVADRYGIIAVYPNSDGERWDIGVAVAPGAPAKRRTGHRDESGDSDNPGGLGGLEVPPGFPFPGLGDAQKPASAEKNPAGDVAFFDQLLDKLVAAYSVDANRLFATGYSDGGLMAFRLGCSMGKRIAAIAAVAAALPKDMSGRCELARSVPLLMLNGTSDPVIRYGGGLVKGAALTTLSVQATAEKWAGLDRCVGKPALTTLPPRDKQGMETRVSTYSGCRDRADVALYAIEGGGNTWPSGDEFMPKKEVGKTSTDLDADEVIWKFFSAHPMPSSSSAGNQRCLARCHALFLDRGFFFQQGDERAHPRGVIGPGARGDHGAVDHGF
jgi:polyhydroxybutyrate depolymerase